MDFYHELLAFLDTLEQKQLDYALCGGVAVALHGYARFTKAIDLLVAEKDLDAVVDLARERGFDLDSGVLTFERGTPKERQLRRVSKAKGAELLTLDLIIVGPALQSAWNTREIFEWQERRIVAVSARGLAGMKRMAGRSQDLLDIEKLGLEDIDDGAI